MVREWEEYQKSLAVPDDVFWAGAKAMSELAAKYGINPAGTRTMSDLRTASESPATKKWLEGIQERAKGAGLDSSVEPAIGDWHQAEGTPGYEPAAAIHVQGALDLDQIKYGAAILGRDLRQIIVLAFQSGDGPDAAWEFEVEDTLANVRGALERNNLPYRSLVPKGRAKTKVIMIDFGNRKAGVVRELARVYGIRPIRRAGCGALLGQLTGQDAAGTTKDSANGHGTSRKTTFRDADWFDTVPSPAGSGIILLLGRKPSK